VSSHGFRHTCRSWLDAVRTPISVQRKMMRHTVIRTTMNIYGDVVTDEMRTERKQSASPAKRLKRWWALQDSNLRLPPCEDGTLPLS
jgi:integrase